MKTINLIGDLNLDIIFTEIEHYPGPGKEIPAGGCSLKAGGSAANTALTLAALDCPASLYSQIGSDRTAADLLLELAGLGIDASSIGRSPGCPTGITVVLSYPGDRMYVSHAGNLSSMRLADIPGGYLRAGAHLHIASYFLLKALKPDVGPLLREAKSIGMSTSLDPGSDPWGLWDIADLQPFLCHLDWFLPNADELKAMSRCEDLRQALRRFPSEAKCVIVKNGSEGALVKANGALFSRAAARIRAADASCAGDCFNAGFLCSICGGASLEQAVLLGNACGALAASRVGLPPRESFVDILKTFTRKE